MTNRFYQNQVALLAALLLTLLILPTLALAAPGDSLVPCTGLEGDKCNFYKFAVLIDNVLKWLVGIAVPVATVLIVYGGVMMVISPTDSGKRTQAKSIFVSSMIGLVAILAAYLIIDTIFKQLTGEAINDNLPSGAVQTLHLAYVK